MFPLYAKELREHAETHHLWSTDERKLMYNLLLLS